MFGTTRPHPLTFGSIVTNFTVFFRGGGASLIHLISLFFLNLKLTKSSEKLWWPLVLQGRRVEVLCTSPESRLLPYFYKQSCCLLWSQPAMISAFLISREFRCCKCCWLSQNSQFLLLVCSHKRPRIKTVNLSVRIFPKKIWYKIR